MNALEWEEFADLASKKGMHADSAALWTAAIADEEDPDDDRQASRIYNAACEAVLASVLKEKIVTATDSAESVALRQKAMDWLKTDLERWSTRLETGGPEARPLIVRTLQNWKVDSDLASIREPEAMSKLPENEQKSWQALWDKVDDLLREAQAGIRPEAKDPGITP
jgi:hypothetical protein